MQDAIEHVIVFYNLAKAFDDSLKDHALGGLFPFIGNTFKHLPSLDVEDERNFIAVFDPFEPELVLRKGVHQISLSVVEDRTAITSLLELTNSCFVLYWSQNA